MPNKLVIVADNIRSKSLKLLAAKLGERLGYRVYRVRPARVGRRVAVVFCGGIDKRSQLALFHANEVAAPAFATSAADASGFACRLVVQRATTTGSEGAGISIVAKENVVEGFPLYTEYIPKKKEFRVHVWNNVVIDVQQKRKKDDHEGERNTQIRNTANGYCFCRSNVVEPDDLRGLALAAVVALGRTYGAVDVIWNEKQNKCFVLEVNSRPGMEGTTLDIYADAILAQMQ